MEDEILVLMHDDDEIDEEDCTILFDVNLRGNVHGGLPYYTYECFDDEYEIKCGFTRQDIYTSVAALHSPNIFKLANGLVIQHFQALCICLKCFTYPCGYPVQANKNKKAYYVGSQQQQMFFKNKTDNRMNYDKQAFV